MTDRFTQIDLTSVPVPDAVEVLSLETIIDEIKTWLIANVEEATPILLESDPMAKVIEAFGIREMDFRQVGNDKVRAVLLPTSWGTNIDNLGADKLTPRLVLDPGDPDAVPPVPPTLEKDQPYKERIQLSWEALSTAGPPGAYEYFARSADPLITHVSVQEPAENEILLTILTSDNDGIAAQAILDAVETAVAENRLVRPLSDRVTVQAATPIDFAVVAEIHVEDGPDSALVLAEAEAKLDAYIDAPKKLARPITRSSIDAALTVAGVWKVVITSPVADIEPDMGQFARPTGTTITVAEPA